MLEKEKATHGYQLFDAGPGLEYNFLLLNLNATLPVRNNAHENDEIRRKQAWFGEVKFRQAISSAIDRNSINRIVYQGRGSPIWTHIPPGNRLWVDEKIPHPARSLGRARQLLKDAGFSWRSDGSLIDSHGADVEFSIIASASSLQRTQMATMIQQDLKDIGIRAQVVPLEFRAMLDRVLQTHNYEAAIMGLGGGDVRPQLAIECLALLRRRPFLEPGGDATGHALGSGNGPRDETADVDIGGQRPQTAV